MPRWSALLLGVLACGEAEPPPAPEPVQEAAPEEAEPEPEPFVEHEVAEGQTLWDIARAYGVRVNDILEANDMTQRDVRRLSKGRVLRIPGAEAPAEVTRRQQTRIEDLPPLEDGAYHLLATGETLWDVAHTYEKTVDEIIARNELTDDDVRLLRPGRPLIIPGIAQSDVRQAEPAARSRGLRHTVARGETIYDLARSFRVSVSALMAANGLTPESAAAIREGERLGIPGARAGETRTPERRLTKRQRTALRRA
ncbi:MAG: LysM peptidoglycan-binding domain-containing protein, partial [Myxococcota bacterium]